MLGVLLAVFALLLVPVYSDGPFDMWDFGLSVIGITFSGSYIYRVKRLSIGELGLLAAILGVSVAIATAVIAEDGLRRTIEYAREDTVRQTLLWVTVSVATAAFCISIFLKGRR